MSVANTFRETIRGTHARQHDERCAVDGRRDAAHQNRVIGAFAALALTLAIAGVYGVMAYAVGRRTAEIGVRMAMGASAGDVLRLMMGQGLRLAVTGIVIGCGLAYALAQLLRGMLFAVAPADPLVFIAGPIMLILTAAAATAIPALRAARVDPMQALRAD